MKRQHKYSSAILASLIFTLAPTLALLVTGVGISAAVAQTATTQNRKAEADRLLQEGIQQFRQGKFREALERFEKALAIFREIDDKASEGVALNNIGGVYHNLGEYPKALEFYQQALATHKEIGDKAGIGQILNNIGEVYRNQGQYATALEFYQQSLAIHKEVGNKVREGVALSNIGSVYLNQGQYPKALEFYQQALAIHKEIADKAAVGTILNNIGEVYRNLGQYPKALESYQQALAIHKEVSNKLVEGITLSNIGLVYYNLGEYPKALEFYQQALAILKEIGNKPGVGQTLNNIGSVYLNQGQYLKALEFFQQALAIHKEIGNKLVEGTTLNNIGEVYRNQRQYLKALEYYQQALVISKQIGERAGEGSRLNNIGTVYVNQGNYPKAWEFYQQALTLSKEIGDKATEGVTLNNIGYLLNAHKQPQLAIVFFKQSVNVYETIRQDLRVLPKEQQESYTKTIADTYRQLADLLLKQNRILEAQRVLDLLKVQELDDYLRNVRGNQQTSSGIDLLNQEQKVAAEIAAIQGKEIEIGKELTQLQKICSNPLSVDGEGARGRGSKCTPAQEQRIAELINLQGLIHKQFTAFIKSDAVKALVQNLNETAQEQNLKLSNLNSLRNSIQKDAVLLYPLILEDRIELVLTSPESPPVRRTSNVKREKLNQAIIEFRQALQNPNSDAKIPAAKLYEWLIKPLESDLKQADAKTIIYAPDGTLRYIPLAALYDGKSWLAQRFAIHNITAASLDDLTSKRSVNLNVLAAAFTKGNYSFEVASQRFDFAGLTFAGKEVENIANTIQNTTKLLDNAFTRDATVPKMGRHNLVHLATHAAFVVGKPEDSFILFGNGDRVTLRDVEGWNLPNVDLIVLSACETGVGDKFGNGEEILGFGYLMQQAGAKAATASLWQVSDGGTQALMDAFYAALQNPNTSKSQALQQAQNALITGDYSALGKERGIVVVERIRNGVPKKVSSRLSHPYYWAPFILIGNGL